MVPIVEDAAECLIEHYVAETDVSMKDFPVFGSPTNHCPTMSMYNQQK